MLIKNAIIVSLTRGKRFHTCIVIGILGEQELIIARSEHLKTVVKAMAGTPSGFCVVDITTLDNYIASIRIQPPVERPSGPPDWDGLRRRLSPKSPPDV